MDEVFAAQLVDRRDDGQAPDEFRDQAVCHEVLGQHLLEHPAGIVIGLAAHLGAEADATLADAAGDDVVEALERAAADEQHVRRVDRQVLLVRVLATTLRRHRALRTLEDLQQRLLDTLAGDVTRDRRVLALAGDLVDLVDVDDPRLGLLDVVVGGLDSA